ncbi:hypothetical protein KQH41_00565 [bacterium]|nr:hypothetical protein [bacterium]
MKYMMASAALFFTITCLSPTADAARSVTLPHTEDFSASNSVDDIAWVTVSNGGTVTRVAQSWRGSSDYCARITPPTSTSGGINGAYAALGAFLFPDTNTINVAFALNIGTTYSSSAANAGGSLINKFIDIFGPGNRSGLLGLNNRSSCNVHEFAILDANTEAYWYQGTSSPTTSPNCYGPYFGSGSGGTADLAGDWIWLNYAVNHNTGVAILRIWDRDGNYSGTQIQISNATDRATNEVKTIGGYYNEYHPTADANSRLLIDDLILSANTNTILPPAGFIGGSTPPAEIPAPVDFRATDQ